MVKTAIITYDDLADELNTIGASNIISVTEHKYSDDEDETSYTVIYSEEEGD